METLNGFKYIELDNRDAKIEHKFPQPCRLYKYLSLNENSISALVNGCLYASHPLELNDSLDCTYKLWRTTVPLNKVNYFTLLNKKLGFSKEETLNVYTWDKKENFSVGNKYFHYFWLYLSEFYGIYSLSAEKNNSLMWGHYTNESGFQIEFNVTTLIENIKSNLKSQELLVGLYPINYVSSKDLKPINVAKYRGMKLPFMYSANLKQEEWSYEKEWRLILSRLHMKFPGKEKGVSKDKLARLNDSRKFNYCNGVNCINSITVGPWFLFNSAIENKELGNSHLQVKLDSSKKGSLIRKLLNFVIENEISLFVSDTYIDEQNQSIQRQKLNTVLERINSNLFKIKIIGLHKHFNDSKI